MMENNFNLPKNDKKRIVIIGAGFGGLKLARELAHSDFQIVMIDRVNFHQFQPLFYQVATSGIEPALISFPIRKIFHQHNNLHFRTAELQKINPTQKCITTNAGDLVYDFLVIATGVNTNYYGNTNIQQYSIPMKTTAEAIYLRNRILESFESAILTEDQEKQDELLSISVVGGGPTGVELSGALAELKNYILPKDYPELDFRKMKIRLYEASPRLLNGMSEKSSEDAKRFLEKLGVEVLLETRISDYNGETLSLDNGKKVKSKLLIWAAGVGGSLIEGLQKSDFARGNRLKVDRHNKLQNYNDVFAIGDIAFMETDKYPNGHPQVAQVAIQQAGLLAKYLKSGKAKLYEYIDKGSLATIGRNMAVADLPGIRISGRFAWLLWLFVHLMAIVGVKNRLFIFINWAQSYFSRNQSLRILIKPFHLWKQTEES